MENFLYTIHPVMCIISRPSECGKSVFLTNLILNIPYEFEKYTSTYQVYIKIYIKNF